MDALTMWSNGRRRPDLRLWQSAKREHAAVAAERDQLARELDELRRQFDWLVGELQDVSEQFRELRLAVLARQRAAVELSELYRQRDIERAKRAERDLSQPLQ
jgi:uncharacterized coiled-coil DUF342 family protein